MFLGLLDLPDGRAQTITDAILGFAQKLGIDMKKMVGLGSDGASVMVGRLNGVSAQKQVITTLLTKVYIELHVILYH